MQSVFDKFAINIGLTITIFFLLKSRCHKSNMLRKGFDTGRSKSCAGHLPYWLHHMEICKHFVSVLINWRESNS